MAASLFYLMMTEAMYWSKQGRLHHFCQCGNESACWWFWPSELNWP